MQRRGAHAGLTGAEEEGGGAASALARAEALLQGMAGVDAGLDSISERLGALALELGDVASELRDYVGRLEADPERLAAVEGRLDALDRLKRKHGGSLDGVLAHAEFCRAEIELLENGEGAARRGAERTGKGRTRRELSWARASAKAGRGRWVPSSGRSLRHWQGWRCPAQRLRSC